MESSLKRAFLLGVALAACSGSEGAVVTPQQSCDATDWSACRYVGEHHPVIELSGGSVENPALKRSIPALLRLPADSAGPLPVVIWSHGGGFDDAGQKLGARWGQTIAAAGYLVIHVAHIVPSATQIATLCAELDIPPSECSGEWSLPQVVRARDVSAVLDSLPKIGEWLSQKGGASLDTSRVAIAGWSAGSQPGLLLAGARIELTPSLGFSSLDLRPSASVALSPQGPGFSGFFADAAGSSWDEIQRPTLVLTGDNDIKPQNPDLLGSIRRQAWENLPGADGRQRLLYSHIPAGVGEHGSYNLGDAQSSDERLSRLSEALSSTVRAFLDAELKHSSEARDYLGSERPRSLAGTERSDWLAK